MNLQLRWDLYQAQRSEAEALATIDEYVFRPIEVWSKQVWTR